MIRSVFVTVFAVVLAACSQGVDATFTETGDAPQRRVQELIADADGDGIADSADNCPLLANANQANTNGVGPGDACELSLVVSTGLLNQYARFQSHKELIASLYPLTFAIGPDLLSISAPAPALASPSVSLIAPRLGVQSLGELLPGYTDTIGGNEILRIAVGGDSVLGGAKASRVWLRLDGSGTVQVAFMAGGTTVATQTATNSGTNLRMFDPGVLFDRIELRVTTGRIGLKGSGEVLMFALGNAALPCPAGYERVGGSCVDINECAGLNHVCDALTTCTNTPGSFSCGACPSGYRGTGSTACVDIDECAEHTATCSTLVACSNTPGSYTCGACPTGYRGNGTTCTDIDECAEHIAGCDAHVTCTNSPGGYTCGPCPSGYTGGGSTGCVDIDECSGPNRVCDPLVACTNTQGSYACGACPAGYRGTGNTSCLDIDECAERTATCSPLVACGNTPGGYQCGACPSGYAGDGHQCVDVDECADGTDGCDGLVACTNTAGSYTCGACPAGYTGDGRSCVDIDECGTAAPCDPRSPCTNTVGGYLCGPCPAGFSGDGFAGCVDVDECAAGTDGCSELVTCGNTLGGYTCSPCPAGYQGDGRTCTDVDECATGSHDCDVHVTCANTRGGYTCGPCPIGTTGDGRVCTDIDECLTGPCDPLVSCTNRFGSYACGACPGGYRGDGYAGCADIDECAVENGGCPEADACVNAPGTRMCVPCANGSAGVVTLCGVGACQRSGLTSCYHGSVIDSCTPGQPAASDGTCDGVDDDCDSVSDEDVPPLPTTCGVGDCRRTGYRRCASGVFVDDCAPGPAASADTICDGRDSDCDGTLDEDFVSTPVYCGTGACARSSATACVSGSVQSTCVPGAGAADDSLCNGIDDDCDGLIDEDFVAVPTTCGVGACGAVGQVQCLGGQLVDTCVPGAPASSDGCGLGDQDCDGYVDEDCCVPSTCEGVGANCGTVPDGCGGTLVCGTCSAPETCGGAGVSQVCGVPNLPPDPAVVAPPLPAGRTASTYEAVSFLFSGPNPIQQGVSPGAIVARRAAAVSGRVISAESGEPLAGARISVLGAPELGFTLSRADGLYDLVFNGGMAATLEITRPGYLPVQRTISAGHGGFDHVKDAALTRLSNVSTHVDFHSTGVQTVVGRTTSDDDGVRRPVIFVPPGAAATAQVNGQSVPLDQGTVRITEFTTGPQGLAAMPGNLPKTTAYTYAMEVSIDEVGPTTPVQFAKALPFYVDNFLGFPEGAAIPLGYYDRPTGSWRPEPDGVVLKVTAIAAGVATLSIDPAGAPLSSEDASALGIEEWELRAVASQFAVGASLWRVRLTHFSPNDLNLGFRGPPPPDAEKPDRSHESPQNQCKVKGSIISCQGRTLAEELPLGDTGLSLRYDTRRVRESSKYTNDVVINLPTVGIPPEARGVFALIAMGSRLVDLAYFPMDALREQYVYHWNGLDQWGRVAPGPVAVQVTTGIDVDLPYLYGRWRSPGVLVGGQSQPSFGGYPCIDSCGCGGTSGTFADPMLPVGNVRRSDQNLFGFTTRTFYVGGPTVESLGLGGWEVSGHHHLSTASGTVYLSDGSLQKVDEDDTPAGVFAGGGSDTILGNMAIKNDARSADLDDTSSIVSTPDGSLYMWVPSNSTSPLWVITPEGRLFPESIDLRPYNFTGGPAGFALIGADRQGNPLLTYSSSLERVSTYRLNLASSSSVPELVYGPGAQSAPGSFSTFKRWKEGDSVRGTELGYVYTVAHSDEATYLETSIPGAAGNMVRVLKVDGTGHATSVVSFAAYPNPPPGYVNGWSQADAQRHITVAKNGDLYYVEAAATSSGGGSYTIRVIRSDGRRELLVGGGTLRDPYEAQAKDALLVSEVRDLLVDNEGLLHFVQPSVTLPNSQIIVGRLRTVTAEGLLTTVALDRLPESPWLAAGNGGSPFLEGRPTQLAIDQQGALIACERPKRRIVRIEPGRASREFLMVDPAGAVERPSTECAQYDGQTQACAALRSEPDRYTWQRANYAVTSRDRSEVYYFDEYGQHLATTDAVTGTPTIQFSYAPDGKLAAVWSDGAWMTVERAGDQVRIGPMVMQDVSSGYARQISAVPGTSTLPAGATWAFDYSPEGLLLKMWDPRANRAGLRAGKEVTFEWEPLTLVQNKAALALLRSDADQTGAAQTLSSEVPEPVLQPIRQYWCGQPYVIGWRVLEQRTIVRRTSPEGRVTRYTTVRSGTATDTYFPLRSTITSPSGEQTMYSDRYGEDGRQDFSGTGVFGNIQRPHMGTARKPTFNTTTTTTVAAVASDGSTTPAARDALTRTVVELREENGATSASQGTVGLVTTTTTLSASGLASRTTRVVEDPVARTRVITSPANRVTTIRYDERDRVSSIAAPGTAPITFTYGRAPDGSSRVIETRQASGGKVRVSSWDYAGSSRYPGAQQTRIDSGRRLTTSFGGYSYGAPTTVTTGTEPPVAVDVDESGALRGVTTAAGTTHTMGIDLLGRMTSYAPPGQTTTEDPTQCALGTRCFTFSPDRSLKSIRLEDGSDVVMTYDEQRAVKDGLLRDVSVPGAPTAHYDYDGTGRLTRGFTDGGSSVGLAYQAKLPIRETWSGTATVRDGSTTVWSGAIAGEVKRFYTAYEELDRLQVMGGASVRYNRDADGLVTSVTDVGGQSLPTLSLPRAPSDGRITGTTQGSVTTTLDYGRDGAGLTFGELTSWSASAGGSTVLQSTYGYDDVGRITRWAQSGAGGYSQVHRYRYDDAGRLTDVLDDAGNELEHYGYDANGNRTEVRRAGEPTEEYRCDATHAATSDDRLCEVDGRTYAYDARGMLASVMGPDGTATFGYDGMGRLHKATTAAGDVIYYAHDAFGRRIARIKNGQLDKGWIYANGLSPIAQLNSAGQLEATYVYASRPNVPDFIVERAGASNVTYRVIADHLGTPRRLVRTSDGAVVYALDVDEWGRTVNETGTKRALVAFGFAGGLWDRDTGLVRFGARDYDPETGRWTAKDPILFVGRQSNLYGYVNNDAVNYTDPEGLVLPLVVGGLCAAGGCEALGAAAAWGAGILAAGVAGGVAGHYGDAIHATWQNLINTITKADSPIWQGLKPYRGPTKTNGLQGKKRRYYEWDHTHNDIEEYDSRGQHIGSCDPETGDRTKGPVPGREIDL